MRKQKKADAKTQHHKKLTLGFIGQGWVGKNYADNFEDRGFRVIRYALEAPYRENGHEIPQCDIVFIAVPTPTVPADRVSHGASAVAQALGEGGRRQKFDDSILRSALAHVGKGKTAVIKSTIPPGTTRRLANEFNEIRIIHIPEFLREAYARYDIDNPERLIVGLPEQSKEYRAIADTMEAIHPKANHTQKWLSAEEAEFIKYTHNTLGYATVVFANVLYDLAQKHGVDWATVKEAVLNNSWYPAKYLDPTHKDGRGAGGHCFIKDFAALREAYEKELPTHKEAIALLKAFEAKNNRLLRDSEKDLDLLEGVYGKDAD